MEIPEPSKRHKIRMNRLFRERVGGSFLPFPEVENLYERVLSKLVIKLKSVLRQYRSKTLLRLNHFNHQIQEIYTQEHLTPLQSQKVYQEIPLC